MRDAVLGEERADLAPHCVAGVADGDHAVVVLVFQRGDGGDVEELGGGVLEGFFGGFGGVLGGGGFGLLCGWGNGGGDGINGLALLTGIGRGSRLGGGSVNWNFRGTDWLELELPRRGLRSSGMRQFLGRSPRVSLYSARRSSLITISDKAAMQYAQNYFDSGLVGLELVRV